MNRLGAWRSLVARTVRVGEVAGSNPVAPIKQPSTRWRECRTTRRGASESAAENRCFAWKAGVSDRPRPDQCIKYAAEPKLTPIKNVMTNITTESRAIGAPYRWPVTIRTIPRARPIKGANIAAITLVGRAYRNLRSRARRPCAAGRESRRRAGGTMNQGSATVASDAFHECSIRETKREIAKCRKPGAEPKPR
jgi:hypothetical protein